MSSIHDALRRAARERETRLSMTAASLVSARSRRPKGKRLRVAAAGVVAAICLALALYSWLDFGSSRGGELKMDAAPQEMPSAGVEPSPEPVPRTAPVVRAAEDLKLFRMGRVLHQAGKLTDARALYEEALRLSPELVEAKNNLGVVLLELKDYIAAEKTFMDVMELRPDYADAQYNLACVYALTGRMEEAMDALSRAVELEPEARGWALADKDLAGLSDIPGFDALSRSE